jgi:Acyl-protein synthetase, LuxE
MLSWRSAVAENQPVNKHRMHTELSDFATRLRGLIAYGFDRDSFDALAVELFTLQYEHNAVYRQMCDAQKLDPSKIGAIRGAMPSLAGRWSQVPFVPTSAFKHLELSCLPAEERTAVFHSSGTTEQKPSRHFHSAESLAVYEASLWKWFQLNLGDVVEPIFLTPDPDVAPHSSLVHMFDTVRKQLSLPETTFTGTISGDGSWLVDFAATLEKLKAAINEGKPLTLFGTAFSFVHLLDYLAENDLRFELPTGSRVMETGGYKNRSRVLPKTELHALITKQLGVPADQIICEYGMSELSSQAYAVRSDQSSMISQGQTASSASTFHFPPWARVQLISPETGSEVAEGETGLIRIFDLANVFSVAAIQTEDLGIRRGDGFELAGRALMAEPRGCSLMNV